MKRYGLDYGGINYDGDGEDLFLEDSEGEWVKYEDAQRIISNMNNDLGNLSAKHAQLSLSNHDLEEINEGLVSRNKELTKDFDVVRRVVLRLGKL